MTYSMLASLFAYPEGDYQDALMRCAGAIRSDALANFIDSTSGLSVEKLQELYTQTFDWNPDTTLDIGWHLFGENYDRGDFLVKLRDMLRRYRVPENRELPDHLSNVLRLLDAMPADERAPFVSEFVKPALEKIRAGVAKSESAFLPLVLVLIEQVEAGGGQHETAGAIQ